jgi:hypothetical protein
MAGTVIADNLQAAATSTLVIKNGVANTPPTIQDSAGTEIGTFCRAWVNFNGTGTVAIRASFNVSSITDNGAGDYTVNFTNAMPDANYVCSGVVGDTTNSYSVPITLGSTNNLWLQTTTSFRFQTAYATITYDVTNVNVAIFGN